MKILFLGLCYWTRSYIERTLESIPDKSIDVVMLECESPRSKEIKEMLERIGKIWRGKFRHIKYSQNIAGEVYRKFCTDNIELVKGYDYVFVSDMDAVFNQKLWDDMITLTEMGCIVSAVPDLVNLTPECKQLRDDYITKHVGTHKGVQYGCVPGAGINTGMQCHALPVGFFVKFCMETERYYIDCPIGLQRLEWGIRWVVPHNTRIYHMGWDGYSGTETAEDVVEYVAWKREIKDWTAMWRKRDLLKTVEVVQDEIYNRPKILFLGLCYWTVTYMEKTLNSLKETGYSIDIVLLENKSPYSEKIAECFRRFAKGWKGKFRHVLYDKNIMGEVYRVFYKENRELFDQYDYIWTSDMDVIIGKRLWDDMVGLQGPNCIVGAVCSSENFSPKVAKCGLKDITVTQSGEKNGVAWGWPPTWGHTGNHCNSFPLKIFKEFMASDYYVVDVNFFKFVRGRYWWISPVYTKIVHLSWDGYAGKHGEDDIVSYIESKKSMKGWNCMEEAKTVEKEFDIIYK